MSFSKVEIKGDIVALSGLHVGTSAAFSPIGAIDNPVIKDPLTNLPYIPGSTLKGKMRSLLARAYNDHQVDSPEKDDQRCNEPQKLDTLLIRQHGTEFCTEQDLVLLILP